MSSRILPAMVLSSMLVCQTFQGQTAPTPSQQPPVIHATTREVLLDLVVRDKHHHTLADLRPEEVEIYEDGVRQTVKAFRNVQGVEQLQTERGDAQKQATAATNKPGSAPSLNSLRQVNFVSVVFAQIAPLDLDFARRAVLEFLKSDTLPNTYVTIYRMDRTLTLVQAYTSNKDDLAKAVDAASKGLYTKDGLGLSATVVAGANASIQAQGDLILSNPATGPAEVTTIQGLQLNPIPGIVIDPLFAANAVSQDASFVLGNALLTQAHLESGLRLATSLSDGMDAMDSLHELVRSEEKLPGRKVILYLADGLAFPVNRREVVDNLISYSNRSGVSFYTVDTRGLTTEDPMMQSLSNLERVSAESAVQKANPRVGHREDDDIELTAVASTQLAMKELAESTGGFAVLNTNEIGDPMQRMMEDIRTHYELAYTPTSTNFDGHFRKIEVKVTRPKVTAQTRKGYFALPELNGEPLQPFEMVALNAINARPAPVEFPYQIALIKLQPKPGAVEYDVAFEVPMAGLKVVSDPKTGKARIQASVVALIHNANGDVVGKVSRDLAREVANADIAQLGADRILYAEPIELPGGHYSIDTAVTDEQAGKTTVKRVSVFVDPGKDFGLSSVEVVRRVDPLAGPRNLQNPFELENGRIMPTFADSLASGKPVELYFIVYPAPQGAGEDPKVILRMFHDGKEVARKPLNLPKAEANGAIPMVVQLLPDPGQCDIVITAKQGTLVAESSLSVKIE
jgi:VWFA-related protein